MVTEPSFISRSNVSVSGSQLASKDVPVTRTSNGPAWTAQRVSRPACTTAACSLPRSMSTSAPRGLVSVTRIRVPGASVNSVPSEKRTPSGAPDEAATHSPTSPRTGGEPSSNDTAGREDNEETTTMALIHSAAAIPRTRGRAGRRASAFGPWKVIQRRRARSDPRPSPTRPRRPHRALKGGGSGRPSAALLEPRLEHWVPLRGAGKALLGAGEPPLHRRQRDIEHRRDLGELHAFDVP